MSPFLAGTPVIAKVDNGFLFVEHPDGELRLPRVPCNDWNGIERATGIPAAGFTQTRCQAAGRQQVVTTRVHPILVNSISPKAPMPLHVVATSDRRTDVHTGDINILITLLNQLART